MANKTRTISSFSSGENGLFLPERIHRIFSSWTSPRALFWQQQPPQFRSVHTPRRSCTKPKRPAKASSSSFRRPGAPDARLPVGLGNVLFEIRGSLPEKSSPAAQS
jgi:hypothetical protein